MYIGWFKHGSRLHTTGPVQQDHQGTVTVQPSQGVGRSPVEPLDPMPVLHARLAENPVGKCLVDSACVVCAIVPPLLACTSHPSPRWKWWLRWAGAVGERVQCSMMVSLDVVSARPLRFVHFGALQLCQHLQTSGSLRAKVGHSCAAHLRDALQYEHQPASGLAKGEAVGGRGQAGGERASPLPALASSVQVLQLLQLPMSNAPLFRSVSARSATGVGDVVSTILLTTVKQHSDGWRLLGPLCLVLVRRQRGGWE
jgi:hypothetical protein